MADPVWTVPADLAVGHVVTADEWNELLGLDGSLAFLGELHNHDGTPGSGGALDISTPFSRISLFSRWGL